MANSSTNSCSHCVKKNTAMTSTFHSISNHWLKNVMRMFWLLVVKLYLYGMFDVDQKRNQQNATLNIWPLSLWFIYTESVLLWSRDWCNITVFQAALRKYTVVAKIILLQYSGSLPHLCCS